MAAIVDIDLELGKIASVVSEILDRRQHREARVWIDLQDDLEAVRLIVQELNRLYIDVLVDLQESVANSENVKDQERAIKNLRHLLRDDRLLSELFSLRGKVWAASQNRRLQRRQFRDIVSSLRGLERSTSTYLDFWRVLQSKQTEAPSADGTILWNLGMIAAIVDQSQTVSSLDHRQLQQLCEEAIRNRRSDLVHAMYDLSGQAIQNIRLANL